MLYCRVLGKLIENQRNGSNNWIQIINRGYKLSCSLSPNLSNNSKFIPVGNNFRAGKKAVNFPTTVGVRSSSQGPAQNKEKIKNYIIFGGLITFAVAVFVGNFTINNVHHDHVYIDVSREGK